MKYQSAEKAVLFGSGKVAVRVYNRIGDKIVAVIDNNSKEWGKKFMPKIPIISMGEYLEKYKHIPVIIASVHVNEMKEQLKMNKIDNYSCAAEIWKRDDVPSDKEIAHRNWPFYLKKLCDKPQKEILEIGSRRVNKEDRWNDYFEIANYTGFDYYSGENVDVVGDIHKLSQYFDKKFDLIFSSAVFEHLAMPWKAAVEIIKLLKPGGYVFIETHYSFGSHERPWHFFQYSEEALNILFPSKFGMKCIKKGCSNLIIGQFSEEASEYLKGRVVGGLYCHSEFLGQKVKDVSEKELSWDSVFLDDVIGESKYPRR